MSDNEAYRYDAKRVLVVGGASGMGAATAKTVAGLGGEVVVMDHASVDFPVAEAIKVVNLLVDAGHWMSSLTGSWEPGQMIATLILGRS